jgi:hypothetical protein
MSDFQEYKSRPVTVLARQVEDAETVVTIHGLRSAVKGDYVLQMTGRQVQNVEQEDGSTKPEEVEYCRGFDVVSADEFEAVYQPVRRRKLPEE